MIARKRKYFVVWLRKEAGTYRFIKKRQIAPKTKEVKYSKDIRHPIDMQFPSYIRGHKIFYFIDVDKRVIRKKAKEGETVLLKGGQLRYEGSHLEYDPELLAYVRTGIVRDLTATLHAKLIDGNAIFLMILSAVAGIFSGIFIAGFL